MSFDISKFVIIDNHAHSLLKNHIELDELGFRQAFTESRSATIIQNHVAKSTHYMDLLDNLERTFGMKSEAEYLEFRAKQSPNDYTQTLWDDVSIGALIIDDGFNTKEFMSLPELATASGRPVYHCRRVENVLESCLSKVESFAELENNFSAELLRKSKHRLVALKTICGYRGGLVLSNPSKAEAITNFDVLKKRNEKQENFRITKGALYHYFLLQSLEIAGEHSLPVQIHTGIGDDDADLLACNPAHMQNLFRSKALAKTNFVLLHCLPYVKEAAFLSSLYANVFMDLSLSISMASPLSSLMLAEALALAPSTKILAGTDGHSCPETHWFAALCWKRGLSQALINMLSSSALKYRQAEEIAGNILHGNAISLYQLEGLA